mmetsp:Transcript_12940/g.27332  ORF Transcript_12940/g.27332 Transcript_12940/m.27332 type:complete len:116 (-) Transcript_12940:930-1277(-)
MITMVHAVVLLLLAAAMRADACSVWLQVHLPKTGGTYFRELAKEVQEIELVSGVDEAREKLDGAANTEEVKLACEYHGTFGAQTFAQWAPVCEAQCDCIWHINLRSPDTFYRSML